MDIELEYNFSPPPLIGKESKYGRVYWGKKKEKEKKNHDSIQASKQLLLHPSLASIMSGLPNQIGIDWRRVGGGGERKKKEKKITYSLPLAAYFPQAKNPALVIRASHRLSHLPP